MNFTHLVGNTPMIRIRYRLDGREASIWAKLEAYNLSGSSIPRSSTGPRSWWPAAPGTAPPRWWPPR